MFESGNSEAGDASDDGTTIERIGTQPMRLNTVNVLNNSEQVPRKKRSSGLLSGLKLKFSFRSNRSRKTSNKDLNSYK